MVPQAVKDLPDPLDTPMKAAETDDLLAQMADEAINKLMSEADQGEMPSLQSSPPIDVPAPLPETAVAVQPKETTEATIESILNQSLEPSPVAAAEKHTQVAESTVPESTSLVAPIAAGEAHEEAPSPAADVKALLADSDALVPSHRGGLLLLPLRLVNAPFGLLDDRMRNAMGQIAIVTMINAIGVLAYVLIFHRHH